MLFRLVGLMDANSKLFKSEQIFKAGSPKDVI